VVKTFHEYEQKMSQHTVVEVWFN